MGESKRRHERRSRGSETRERIPGALAAAIGATCIAFATGQVHGLHATLLFVVGSFLSAGGLAALSTRARQMGALFGQWFGEHLRRFFQWTRRRWKWAGVTTVLVLIVATVVWRVVPRQGSACVAPFELRMAATAEIADVVDTLGSEFEQKRLTPDGCLRVHVRAYSVPSAGVAFRAFAAGWPDERGRGLGREEDNNPVRDVGPEPDVWVAGSSAEVGRVQDTLKDENRTDMTFLNVKEGQIQSIARTDVVLALPDLEAERYGWPKASLTWNDVRRDILRGELHLRRANPSTSAAAGLGTEALYLASGGKLDVAQPDPGGLAHDLEREIAPSGDDTSSVLCELRQLDQRGRPLPAVLLPAKAVIDYAHGVGLSPDCDVRSGKPRTLFRAFSLPATPQLDYPCVVVSSLTWSTDDGAPPKGARPYETIRQGWAKDLCSFLADPQSRLRMRLNGFRDNQGVTPLNDDLRVLGDPAGYQPQPTSSHLKTAINLWTGAKRPARVLVILDVSGSMTTTFSGPGGTRLSAATDAARQTLKQMSPSDQLGLWSFSTDLDHGRDYRRLVPVGRMSEPVGGTSRERSAGRALAGLRPERDTGLYDTIFDALETMEPGSGADMVNAVVILTDGENDDDHQTHSWSEVDQLARKSRAQLMVIALGEASCAPESELPTLAQDTDGLCLDAGRSSQLDRAFDQVKARLWGAAT